MNQESLSNKTEENQKISNSLEQLISQLSLRNEEILEKSEEIVHLTAQNQKAKEKNSQLALEIRELAEYNETYKFVSAQMIDSLGKEVKALENTNKSLRKVIENSHKTVSQSDPSTN